jgi:hypothetical protein
LVDIVLIGWKYGTSNVCAREANNGPSNHWTFAKIPLKAPTRTRVLINLGQVYGFLTRSSRLAPQPRAPVSGSDFTASQSHVLKFAKAQ